MKPLIDNDIESELSYAYLHAIAAHAGAGCTYSHRHEDNHGVDARLTIWRDQSAADEWTEVNINVQLKATVKEPTQTNDHFSYFVNGVDRYNHLRANTYSVNRILVVMFLPPEKSNWLISTADELIMKRCAYWVSLAGASESVNPTGQTVYLPKNQIFNVAGLFDLSERLAKGEKIIYSKP